MKSARTLVILLACLPAVTDLAASGPVGVFAVIEKVAFEPNEQAPERIKLWGAFVFADGGIQASGTTATAARGYLYFRMPAATEAPTQNVRTEWSDLKAMAGTGQAVAFGNWGYIGAFNPDGPNQIFVTVRADRGFQGLPLRVYNAKDTAPEPAPYVTNTGIVKIPDSGAHAAVVKRLRDSLKR